MLRRDISQGEISILPLDPLGSVPCYIQRNSSRFLINGGGCRPLKRFLRYTQKSSSNAGWLRSTPVGFAEHFRSVCRNLSCKLPSHAFAGLTALVAVGSPYHISCYDRQLLNFPENHYRGNGSVPTCATDRDRPLSASHR